MLADCGWIAGRFGPAQKSSNVKVILLMSDALMQIPSNVSAPVLISADLCRMSQLAGSFPMQMQIP